MSAFSYGFSVVCERKSTACLIVLLLLLEISLNGAKAAKVMEVERHLHRGREYMERGRPEDSLTHFHNAVESDPENYISMFQRGNVYMELSKPLHALQDFDKVLDLKPDFTEARVLRGKVHMKMGNYDLAEADLLRVLAEDPFNDVANDCFERIQQAKEQWIMAQTLTARGSYNASISVLNKLILLSPWSSAFRQTRADAYIVNNDYVSAIADLKMVNEFSEDRDAGFFNTKFCMKSKTHQKTRYLKRLWCDNKSQKLAQNLSVMVLNLLVTFCYSLRLCLI